jgi:hypothetical protein
MVSTYLGFLGAVSKKVSSSGGGSQVSVQKADANLGHRRFVNEMWPRIGVGRRLTPIDYLNLLANANSVAQ